MKKYVLFSFWEAGLRSWCANMRRHSPDVEFCAYTIPHPSEAKMNVRIQTYGRRPPARQIQGTSRLTSLTEGTAVDALQKGLRDLAGICDVMTEEFGEKIANTKS